MPNTKAAFTIYNASAGSGKTYTLVKNYLQKILSSTDKGRYKQILAVTFTNKAVAEMKERILKSLHGFSQSTILPEHKNMFLEIKKELHLSEKELQIKSKSILHYLLHNYTAFNVQTIDKFTQSVIRTFAFDLNLNNNFEVELDSNSIIEQSVDELLGQVGQDANITKVVLDFMKSNINEDNAWNIKNSLLDISKIITNENDIPHLKHIENKTIEDFEHLKEQLQNRISKNKILVTDQASELLSNFETKGIVDHFNRNTIPNHFRKIKNEATAKFSKTTKWQQEIENYNFYTKSCSEASKQIIDTLRPYIESVFYETKKLIIENEYILRILKNITQMSLLQIVYSITEKLKRENNILLITDFNQLIFETIKNQPTPFIYERLGEKFKDFFIDEFQDTSVMQWQNLIPLADNAISSIIENTEETGSVTLVGDAKQAIYRWRGGKAEQFIGLYKGIEKPFSNPDRGVENLRTNYRSYSNIIKFNNDFFTYLAGQFSNPIYKQLYIEGNHQNENDRKGGYIQFDFINGKNSVEKNELYVVKTLESIHQIISNGFDYKDVSILVRKNSQGVLLANYLNDHAIPVISSESLLLKNSNTVELLISYTYFINNSSDKALKLNFLKALSIYLNIEKTHSFLNEHINQNLIELKASFQKFNLNLALNPHHSVPIYEAFENCITAFGLNKKADAYLQFFLDFIFEYIQKRNLGIIDFLVYWETKKEKLSIAIPEGKNAIQILSIHKSKGLEFPVVIYPFADTEIYRNNTLNVWLPIDEFSAIFSEAYISHNKTIFESYSDTTQKIQNEITELQELDNFNVLYVALTRAKEQLYVISNHNKEAKSITEGSFQSYFLDFLSSQQANQLTEYCYSFGNPIRKSLTVNEKENSLILKSFINSNKLNHGIRLVIPNSQINEKQQVAIDKGKIIHEIFSKIYDRSDVEKVLTDYQSKFDNDYFQTLKKNIDRIVNNSLFKTIFKRENSIYNEREFAHNENVIRPDRIEINTNNVVYILDYKTGEKDDKYLEQIEKYASIFKNSAQKIIKKYIIYIQNSCKIEEL